MTFCIASQPQVAARIEWQPTPLNLADQDLSPEAPSPQTQPPRLLEIDRAVAWLQGALAAGPVPSQTLIDHAATIGISERNLNRARARLGVSAVKEPKFGGGWVCSLPVEAARDCKGCQTASKGGQENALAALAPFAVFEDGSQLPAIGHSADCRQCEH
jgi:hypothetical protein